MSSNTTSHEGPTNGAYGYTPTTFVCIIFICLFAISGLLHLGQAIKWRTWWMLPTMVVGCIGETVGWSGRLWSSQNIGLLNPFLMQITSTIISPSFMSAANFTILGAIIKRLGTHYTWITPRWYLIIFISLDLVSLVIQSIGGAKASQAAENNEDAGPGGHIMLYGIIIQMIALTIYVALGTDFVVRYYLNKPARKPAQENTSDEKEQEREPRKGIDTRTQLMLLGLILNSLFLFIRAVYRTIELNDGWNGPIITNQSLFNWLDGTQITLATYTFNFLHPGFLLRPKREETDDSQLTLNRLSVA